MRHHAETSTAGLVAVACVLGALAGLLFVEVGRLESANAVLRQQVARAASPPPALVVRERVDVQALQHQPVEKWRAPEKGQKEEAVCGSEALELIIPFVCTFGQVIAIVNLRDVVHPEAFAQAYPQLLVMAFAANDPFELPSDIAIHTGLSAFFLVDSGRGNIPTQLGLLTRLSYFYLDNNKFSPTVPSQLGQLTRLSVLVIDNDQATGEPVFPTELGRLNLLSNLRLSGVGLSGSIPSQFANVRNVTILDLSRNRLEGTVPSQMLGSPSLRLVILHENLLSGALQVPTSRSIAHLDVGANLLEGTLPLQLVALAAVTTLNCSGNLLHGSIPTQLGKLVMLQTLALQDNQLTGTIPTQLGLLTALEVLELGSNQLSGTVPRELATLSHLNTFNLSLNLLEGVLPDGVDVLVTDCRDSGLRMRECGYVAPNMLSLSFFVIFVVLVLLMVLGVAGLARRVYMLRETKPIRAASPRFLLSALMSLCLGSLSVPAMGVSMLDVALDTRVGGCIAYPILLSSSVVLLLVSIVTRNYPIWRIFTNPNLSAVRVRSSTALLAQVGSVLLNLAWSIPFVVRASPKKDNFHCNFGGSVLLTVGLGYVAMLALCAVAMCVLIRNAPSLFNDTKHIADATLFGFTFSLVMGVLAAAANGPTPQFVALSLSVLGCCAAFVVLVLAPKIFRTEIVLELPKGKRNDRAAQ